MWPLKRKYLDKQSVEITDSWSVSQGQHGSNPMIVRVNRGVAAAVGHPAFKHHVGVALPLHTPDANGFPAADEAGQLDAIEDLLVSRLTTDRQCVQVATISTGAMREFVFYSSAPSETDEALRALAHEVATHRMQHVIQPDPKWRVYRELS